MYKIPALTKPYACVGWPNSCTVCGGCPAEITRRFARFQRLPPRRIVRWHLPTSFVKKLCGVIYPSNGVA